MSLKSLLVAIFACVLFVSDAAAIRRGYHRFVVREATYTRLCENKKILTVNGMFPGPTIEAYQGDTITVDVHNRGNYNITIHWHGVKMLKNPWSDGPEYITQCPIKPGGRFRQNVIFAKEVGTLWWHAHSDWFRATVHGPIFIYPKPGFSYPFPKPAAEIPIILGQWWKEDIVRVLQQLRLTGGQPIDSDAYMINGQPGDLYPCSQNGTFKAVVKKRETYLLRIINAALNEILYFGIDNHTLITVATDAHYSKPQSSQYVVVGPGQTLDCLLHADQTPASYYMAASPYVSGRGVNFSNTTTTAILQYDAIFPIAAPMELPLFPAYNDTLAAMNFSYSLRSLNSQEHPAEVPREIDQRIISTISINARPCPTANPNETCQGPNGTRLAASMNKISFVRPPIDILEAYFYKIPAVFLRSFPNRPPFVFIYTADELPLDLEVPKSGTKVKVFKYNSSVELVFQNTNILGGIDHPMHLHGMNFFVVGWGFGNFDEENDPMNYNLDDPQERNTIIVPRGGWTAVRFKAMNPGVWFMHCHFERHMTWGMDTVFIITDGSRPEERMLPPPPDMPPC